MTKGDTGIWSGTTARPARPGAWRYTFKIDGVTVADPRNVNVTTSQTQVQSLLVVPGEFSETRDVPHGIVGAVRYVAKTLDNRLLTWTGGFLELSPVGEAPNARR